MVEEEEEKEELKEGERGGGGEEEELEEEEEEGKFFQNFDNFYQTKRRQITVAIIFVRYRVYKIWTSRPLCSTSYSIQQCCSTHG
jgi:hypothetical protein